MRKPDWQASFWAAVETERTGAFVWGERDCVLVATRVCDSILDEPWLEAVARSFGTWTTAREAATMLERFEDMQEALSAILGSPTPKSFLQQGDLVLCSYEDPDGVFNRSLGFHDGVGVMVVGDSKLVPIPQSLVICGWRIL